MITLIGLDPDDPELKETPRRIADMYKLCTKSCEVDPAKFLSRTLPTEHNELVVLRGINFFSLCPHHFLPWFGKVYIAYIPHHKILGLSKFISLVEVMSQRFQLQETLTSDLANLIVKHLDPKGVMVIVKARHTCTFIRGRYDYSTMTSTAMETVTSAVRGLFLSVEAPRNEALKLFNLEEDK